MKARLSFEYDPNKPTEVDGIKDLIHAADWKLLVWDIQALLYSIEKSDNIAEKSAYDVIDEVRTLISDTLKERGLVLD